MSAHGTTGHNRLHQYREAAGYPDVAALNLAEMAPIGEACERCKTLGAKAQGLTSGFQFFRCHFDISQFRAMGRLLTCEFEAEEKHAQLKPCHFTRPFFPGNRPRLADGGGLLYGGCDIVV